MELNKIERLLEKYFEATATAAEEQELQAYFLQDTVAPHLQEYQSLFRYFANERTETLYKTLSLKPRRNRILFWRGFSIAATVLLLASIYIVTIPVKKPNSVAINDPEQAYRETQKALNLIAQTLHKGTDKMAYLNEFEKSKNKIFIND